MKKTFILQLVLMLCCMVFSTGAFAQALLVEDFNYTAGSQLTANGWAAHSGGTTNPIQVGDGLAFSGYAGSGIGGAAIVNKNGQDVDKGFSTVSSGSLYVAFMFKTGTTNYAGYFLHLAQADSSGACSTSFTDRVFVSANGTQVGISQNSTTPTNMLTVTPGNTYLGVIEHNFTTGYSNLYVFDNFPSTQPTSGFVTTATSTTNSASYICLRQYNNNQDITVDGIRVATTWADAVAASSTNMANAPTFSPVGGIVTTPSTSVTLSCTTPGASIYYTLDGSTPDNTSTLYSSPITLTQTTTIKAIAYATGYTASPVVSSTYTFPVPVANIAAFKTAGAADNTQLYHITGNVVVTAQKGNNNLYLQDATGGLVLYQQSGGLNFQPGDVFQGTLTGTYATYQNQPEFIPNGTLTAVPGGTVTPVAATISQIKSNFDFYANNLVTLTDVTIPQGTTYTPGDQGANIIFVQNGDSMTLYNAFKTLDMTIANGMVANMTGIATKFNTTYELSPRFNADIVDGTPQPSITILAPVEGAVYLTIDTLPINFDIQNFTVGTDGLLKIESYMLTQLNMPNPIFLDNAAWTALRTFGIAPPLPENWVTAVVSLVGLDSLPLVHPATDTVHFRTYKPSLPVPTITPANGTYPDSVVVSISCSNLDAAIRYTLDNSEPTETSTLYTGPFTLTTNTTVKAKAFLTNWNPSDAAAVATYTIAHEPALAVSVDTLVLYNPTGIPMGYSFDVTSAFVTTPITITCDNSCFNFSPATIPVGTNSANVQISYNCSNYPGFGTLTVTGDTMTRHIALIAMTKLPAPTFTPATGTSDTLINVTIACSEPSAIISYSLNGAANQVYTGPITLNTPGTYTITAMADGMYWLQSNQVTATYTVTAPAPPAPVEAPVISPNGGFSYDPVQVTITCPTQGADIYYTTDGSTPTTASTHYTAPFTLSANATVKAKAFLTGHDASGVVSATYTFPIEVANIAAFKAANTATNNTIYKITGDVTFVYENGANFYIQDATGGLLIYDVGDSISGTYNEGDVISGGICGTYTLYNGLVEMKPSHNIAASTTNTGAVAPVITDVATIISQYDNFESRLVTLQQVTFTSGVTFTNNNASNANIEQNGSTMVVRSVFKNIDMTIPAGQVADVTGFVLRYINNENTSYQIAPRGNNDIVFASTPQQDTVTTPVITVNPLTNGMHSVSITCATADAEIHYTTDGTTPTAASNAYSESFIVGSGTTIKAIATKAGMVNSEVAVYTVSGIQNYDNVIELYPNPTTDKCVVRCADKVLNVAVYNVFGQLLETIPADGNTVEVSLSQFATGTYFLRVATENGVATRTVVRK